MAGSIDIVTRAFAGAHLHDSTVVFDPQPPPQLRHAGFTLVHRGQRLQVDLGQHRIQVAADPCATNPGVNVQIAGNTTALATVFPSDAHSADR